MEPSIYEVFFVVHPVSTRVASLAATLTPLVNDAGPTVHAVDLFYRAAADTALFGVHYDERTLGSDALRALEQAARGLGLRIVDPARLSANERKAFFEVRLPQFDACGRGLPSVRAAVTTLVGRATSPTKLARATPRDGTPRVGSPGEPSSPRAPGERMVVTVPPAPPPPRPRTLPPAPSDESRPTAIGRIPGVGTRGTSPGPLALSLEERARAVTALGIAPRGRTPGATRPLRAQRAGSEPPDVVVDAGAIADAPAADGTALDVRFLRGSEWVPARVRALSVRGAYVVTSAPPRLGDAVHVSLSFGGRTALMRGTVYHVTSAEDALSTGASGFAVRFPEYACPARQRLVEVLLAARNAGITVRPPPSRASVRFPVRWPVHLAGAPGPFRGEAHDVSSGGFFVATPQALDVGAEIRFAMPLDVADAPVEGRARVARVQGAEAAARGIAGGFGLQILDMDGPHRGAWAAFLARVRRRSEKRILVGAAPERLGELVSGLGAAGYAVTAGSDPGVLMRLAELDPNPPDAAVIDGELAHAAAPSGWLEQVFTARQVHCITVHGDVSHARSLVDRALLVDTP